MIFQKIKQLSKNKLFGHTLLQQNNLNIYNKVNIKI